VEKPYSVTPENASQAEAFAVARRALQKTAKEAIGKIAFSGREHIVAITAAAKESRGGMMAYTLRYPNELRRPSDYFRDIKDQDIDENSLELAEALIAKRSSPSRLSKFEHGYDRLHVNAHEYNELEYWSKELGVRPDRLRALVNEHGAMAAGTLKMDRVLRRGFFEAQLAFECR
jgi:hypothetical protein